MTEMNPYAPPQAAITETASGKCRRDGKWVVVETGSDLPPRCIICNAAVTEPIKRRTVYWHTPWLYLLFLINVLVYVIAALIARKSFPVSPGLCKLHATKRMRRILSFVGAAAISCIAAVLLLVGQHEATASALFVLSIFLLVFAGLSGRRIYPREITKEYARLGGCKEPFLASLRDS
jgi:hypothetical protein